MPLWLDNISATTTSTTWPIYLGTFGQIDPAPVAPSPDRRASPEPDDALAWLRRRVGEITELVDGGRERRTFVKQETE